MRMHPSWATLTAILCHLIVTIASEEFTNEDTAQMWTIPDVSYPDPSFVHDIKSTTEIISSQGFPVEKHHITTEDGYILALHRIPGRGTPVLMNHGFAGASDQWIFRNDSSADLPFILSKAGFDVWLGNYRGNVYSRHHATLSPDSLEFWNFSLHEYASRDLPAMIELVRHRSGRKRLIYMGYSYSGGAPYMLADTRPEYTRYIRLNLLFAPFAFGPREQKSLLIKTLKPYINYRVDSALRGRDLTKVEVSERTNSSISRIFRLCGERSMMLSMCRLGLQDFIGRDTSKNFNKKYMARIFSYTRGGTSIKALYHIWSMFKSGRYLRFDALPFNRRGRGHTRDLEYDVTKMATPTMMWYARGDNLVERASVEKLASLTQNLVHLNLISQKRFNHYDYWLHEDINRMVHFEVMAQLNTFLESSNDLPE